MEYSKKRMLGAMRANCFNGLEKLIKLYNIETVLEFGSGYSSCWFAERVKHLYTVDHSSAWFPKGFKNTTCISFSMKHEDFSEIGKIRKDFDLVLIDCISIYCARQKALDYMKNNLQWKVLCIHDWGRDNKKYDRNYLSQFEQNGYGELKVFFNKNVKKQ